MDFLPYISGMKNTNILLLAIAFAVSTLSNAQVIIDTFDTLSDDYNLYSWYYNPLQDTDASSYGDSVQIKTRLEYDPVTFSFYEISYLHIPSQPASSYAQWGSINPEFEFEFVVDEFSESILVEVDVLYLSNTPPTDVPSVRVYFSNEPFTHEGAIDCTNCMIEALVSNTILENNVYEFDTIELSVDVSEYGEGLIYVMVVPSAGTHYNAGGLKIDNLKVSHLTAAGANTNDILNLLGNLGSDVDPLDASFYLNNGTSIDYDFDGSVNINDLLGLLTIFSV